MNVFFLVCCLFLIETYISFLAPFRFVYISSTLFTLFVDGAGTGESTDPEVSVSGSLPGAIAVVGRAFNYSTAGAFSGKPFEYLLEGLPRGSGFSMDPFTGEIRGNPGAGDALASQPLKLTVEARDAQGAGVSTGLVILRKAHFFYKHAHSTYTRTRTHTHIPQAIAVAVTSLEVGDAIALDVSGQFAQQSQGKMTYSLRDLPAGTGLVIDPNTGRISGAATLADFAMEQPMKVTAAAMDSSGQVYTIPFRLLITNGPLSRSLTLSRFLSLSLAFSPSPSLSLSLSLSLSN